MIFLLAVMLIVASLGNVKSDWKDMKEAANTQGMSATKIFAEGEEQDSVSVKFKTIQTVSSDEEYVELLYSDEEGDPKGTLRINFGLPKISTELVKCQDSPVEISANLPDEVEKVWTVVRTTDYRILVHCNEVEVMNFLLSDETCPSEYDWFGTMKRWDSAWQGEVHSIKLRSSTIGVLSGYMMSMESCDAGQFLDAADFCKDCPENQWSANENDDACTLCPEGRKVGAGLGKAEIDCKFEDESEHGDTNNYSHAVAEKISFILLLGLLFALNMNS